jgi:hypothetical protein
MTPHLFDRVALLNAIPGKGLERGDVGTIVEVYDGRGFELEFVKPDGSWRALAAVGIDECLPLRLPGSQPAISGVLDSALWYWYDPESDLLEVRLASKRAQQGEPEVSPNGYTVLRDPQSRAALGMIVAGFWERFGTGGKPEAAAVEGKVRSLAPRLSAA